LALHSSANTCYKRQLGISIHIINKKLARKSMKQVLYIDIFDILRIVYDEISGGHTEDT
jgi:hypothetical protein